MTPAEWRALLEAYLEGRLSTSAFVRRFMQAWRAARETGEPVPGVLRGLVSVVEDFEARAGDRDIDVEDDTELTSAVRYALADLQDSSSAAARTFDRARAREEMRRFSVQMSGCAGLGCLIASAWFALCVLQIWFVSEFVGLHLGLSPLPATVLGFFLAFVPIVGNIMAFIDATEVKHWPTWAAAIVFFAAPVATLVSGWTRWRRFR